MSKEIELLKEALEWMQYHSLICPELVLEIQELLAQPQKNRLIEVYSDLLKSLIENDGAGLKELKAFDLETYNKLKDIFGASDLLAQPEREPKIEFRGIPLNGDNYSSQEPVAWMNESGSCFLSDGNKYSDYWTPLYTSPPKGIR